MTQLRLAKCDGCEKTVEMTEVSGWLSLQTVVASVEEYIAKQETPAYHGDFCSLPCLSQWAVNAAELERLGGLE